MKIEKIVVASHNQGKIKEIGEMLKPLNIAVVPAAELELPDVEETGTTFEENARLKADALSKLCGLPCLADDSGLCVDALGGRPGVYSARYAPNRDFDKGMEMLLGELAAAADKARKAHFSCVLAFAFPGMETKVFEGRVDGRIATEKHGNGGFGYDPLFLCETGETFAEISPEVKNAISHRGKALRAMKEALKEAKKAYNKLEVPVGAVIVKDGKIIARGYNQKETKTDTTKHAEIIAIQKASQKLKSWRLLDCEMYVTLEPCSMCAGAIINSRIKKVYYGTSDNKTGAVGSVLNLFEDFTFNHKVEYEKNIMQTECENILKQFFKELRKNKNV